MKKDEWLTPPFVLQALGEFDLDPCAPIAPPWRTARRQFSILDNGLSQPWSGRVWCNPPYGKFSSSWLDRCAQHKNATALIFARTETESFFTNVWRRAYAILFLEGRLTFLHVDGSPASANSGAPSVLIAYDQANADMLEASGLPGAFVDGWRVAS